MLGSMAELGDDSLEEHRQIVELIKQHAFTNVVLVGNNFAQIHHPFLQFATAKEAKEWLQKQNISNAYFLIKGSRTAQMETIIQ